MRTLADLLLNSKQLEPLAAGAIAQLEEVEQLDVTTFSEADVRAEVIDPIVRALGYRKQTSFSAVREKHLKVLDKDLFADYSLLVLEEHFWVIEAKKVLRKEKRFTADELKQALSYAVHPEINAALVVLCDGRMFQVFDREEDLVNPVVTVEIQNLVRDFDKLRILLAPWQAWFFQKRRVLRLVDKVFDRELTMGRLEEFRHLVAQQLDSKRSAVAENYRRIAASLGDQHEKHLAMLRECEPRTLIEIQFFWRHSQAELETISSTLVSACHPSSFAVLNSVFPDHPRFTTDRYWQSALHFLLSLEALQPEVDWLPAYLADPDGPRTKTATAAARLIHLCLTGFASRDGERVVLLHSFAARRLAKQMMAILPPIAELGQLLHVLVRNQIDETSFRQQTSSPEGNLLHFLDDVEVMASQKFVTDYQANGRFDTDRARLALKEDWRRERSRLGDGKAYREASKALRLDQETAATEAMSVVYDQLGHLTLCVVSQFPKWKEYVQLNHLSEVERLARFGSWMAKELLGLEGPHAPYPRATLKEVADQFFYGDVETCQALARGYGYNA